MVDRKTIEVNLEALTEWAGGGDVQIFTGHPARWKTLGEDYLPLWGDVLRIAMHTECYRCGIAFEEQKEAFCEGCGEE